MFNLLFNNRDDHAKNFAYRMNEAMQWKAPVNDLTFNVGPGGYHQMSVMGEALRPERGHLIALAQSCEVSTSAARAAIDQMCEGVQPFIRELKNTSILRATLSAISGAIAANVARLA